MFSEKVGALIQFLQRQELDAEDGITSPNFYMELFAAYLYQNDLYNARYCWKRIPQDIKNGNAELERMYQVYIALWNNSSADFFKAANFDWSASSAELMFELKEKIKLETIDLISNAYVSIYEDVLLEMTNLSPESLQEMCQSLGWSITNGSFPRLIIPKAKSNEKVQRPSPEEQLFVLTDFVSFLEN